MGLIVGLYAPKADTILTNNLNCNTIKVRMISKPTTMHHMHAFGCNKCTHMVHSDGFRFDDGFWVYAS